MSKPWALYNENDEFAAAWLEQLIAAGHIANGIVDRRSIADLRADDLRGFRQVHLFAGIGVWSYVFRRAGISDDTEAWSASCPCQPFSAAGAGGGMDDERHLWPHAHHLIRERRPRLVFGEQVASKDGLAWLDLVQADMEGTRYAFGAVDTCAAGFGAPHIRQRQYWFGERIFDVADADGSEQFTWERPRPNETKGWWSPSRTAGCSDTGEMANTESLGRHSRSRSDAPGSQFTELGLGDGLLIDGLDDHDDPGLEGLRGGYRSEIGHGQGSFRPASKASQSNGLAHNNDDEQRQGGNSGGASGQGLRPELGGCSEHSRLADTDDGQLSEQGRRSERRDGSTANSGLVEGYFDSLGLADVESTGREERHGITSGSGERGGAEGLEQQSGRGSIFGVGGSTGPTNGFWADVDWLFCRDGKWRPVEPGTFPLAHGSPARVGRLRGYGNAINAEQAIGFVEAYLEKDIIEIEGHALSDADEPAFEDLM